MKQHIDYAMQMESQPFLLNDITSSYLKELSVQSSSIIKWKNIQQILTQISSPQTHTQQSILLFNLLKHIITQTFTNVNGLKDNRIYCWMGMMFAQKCTRIIQQIQTLTQQIQEVGISQKSDNQQNMINQNSINQNSQQHNRLIKGLLKFICFGLLLGQVMISLVEKANTDNTSNRVIYPQLYRFVLISLQSLSNFIKPYLNAIIPTEIKTTKMIQQLLQQKTIAQKEKQQLNNKPKQIKKSKKSDKNKKGLKQIQVETSKINSYKQISSQILVKIIDILQRSFKICKKNVISNINIVKNDIYESLKQIIEGQGTLQFIQIQKQSGIQLNNKSIKQIVLNYITQFQQKQPIEGEQHNKEIQIDQENKIIQVKQLTPRFLDEQTANQLKKLRIKKKKLSKKIQSDARTAKRNKLQEQRVLQDVRHQRIAKRQKKELFVMQKQTQQAKKQHNKMKRIKQIQKQGKKNKNGDKTKKIRK